MNHLPPETDRERHHRSVRLSGYDYSHNGAYFITICTHNREHLFGEIENGAMRLNPAGRMIGQWWRELEPRFPDIELDVFAIMPNHIHGIIVIKNDPVPAVGAILCNRPEPVPDLNPNPNTNTGAGMIRERGDYIESPLRMQKIQMPRIPNTYDGLGRYVSWFKRMTVNEYIRRVKTKEFPRFEKSIWQRNYHERIIRNENEGNRIREYIEKNPESWEQDELNSFGNGNNPVS